MKVIEFEMKDFDAVKGEIEECLAERDEVEFPATAALVANLVRDTTRVSPPPGMSFAARFDELRGPRIQEKFAIPEGLLRSPAHMTATEVLAIRRQYGESRPVHRSETPAAESPARARGATASPRPPRDG